jgi:hypothetical protein
MCLTLAAVYGTSSLARAITYSPGLSPTNWLTVRTGFCATIS